MTSRLNTHSSASDTLTRRASNAAAIKPNLGKRENGADESAYLNGVEN